MANLKFSSFSFCHLSIYISNNFPKQGLQLKEQLDLSQISKQSLPHLKQLP
jgi:hypothetical protein